MDEDLKQYLEDMKRELLEHTDSVKRELLEHTQTVEARLNGKLDRAAQSFAVDGGHIHSEIRSVFDRLKKIDTNVTTGVEMVVRQSRWHDETDTKALELLVRVNELERRLHELESEPYKPQ